MYSTEPQKTPVLYSGSFIKSLLLLITMSVIQDVISITSNRTALNHPSVRNEAVKNRVKRDLPLGKAGPRQPEIQSFIPSGVNDLVNPFTGDFSYNIPLLDVGGYPVNIFYQSGVTMEDEASWVGLGWNLTPGSVNRIVRGLPDDFSGEEKITKEVNMKDNETWALRTGPSTELFGFGLGASVGLEFNSYTGFGLDIGANAETSVPLGDVPARLGGSAGIRLSSGGGFSRNLNASVNMELNKSNLFAEYGSSASTQVSAGVSSNSRAGVNATFSAGFNASLINKSTLQSLQLSGINYPLSFAKEVYTPQIDLPQSQRTLSFNAKGGGEVQGFTVSGFTQGSYSNQYLSSKQFTHSAYGYLYSEKGKNDADALYDFNRDHGNPFEPENPQLPMTNFSYDIYSISGQGFSGNFRPFRTDVGTVHNNIISTNADNIGGGAEVAGGSLVKVGLDGSFSSGSAYSGKWRGENELENTFSFKDAGIDRTEAFYFKNIGELNAMSNEEHFSSLNGFEPFPLKLKERGLKAPSLTHSINGDIQSARMNKEVRNTDLSVLRFEEKRAAALAKTIHLFAPNAPYDTLLDNRIPLNQHLEYQRKKQIAEIRITKDDGSRYYYDLPVYNTKKREVSFSIGGAVSTQNAGTTNIVTYRPGQDNSTANRRGTTQHFSATETPSHAYAYMLTAIVSSDYVDLSGDGPSSDDLGSYTKFNYTKGADQSAWRMPIKENSAFFQKGVEANPMDDMANYTYGEKEIYYLHSIETRNHVAEFKVSPRLDVQSVKGENGGLTNRSASMKLDSILLYAKSDRVKNGRNAIPVKSILFKYDYALCRNHPGSSNGQGKLTLQSIVIAQRNGNRTKLSPYRFSYSDINPSYSENGGDRWGTYRKDSTVFPLQEKFTPQHNRKGWMDKWASAWSLTTINDPNGGTMKIFYESDDYGYVQEKRAMQMFRIRGLSTNPASAESGTVYSSESTANYIHFDLVQPIRIEQPNKEDIFKEYLQGINEVFFQVNTNTRFGRQAQREVVNGFARFNLDAGYGQSYGLSAASNGLHTSGWIKLENEAGYESGEVFHPFANATFNMVRTGYPQAGNVSLQQNSSIDQVVTAFAGMADAVQEAVGGGFSNRMRSEGIGSSISTTSSFIRLNNPNKVKLGGGSRVKRIELHDNWSQMTQQRDSSYFYGQEFEYTKTEILNGSERVISSGVASYEPLVGGEENPYVLPRRYNSQLDILGLSFGPTDRKMETQPYGESFFPGPSVGYSEVRIRNLRRQGVKITASGFTKKEYYTARDFPVKYKGSSPQLHSFSIPAIPLPLAQIGLDMMTVVQSHVVELNDMHGKEKAVWEYREADSLNPISGIEYHYKRESPNGNLNNKTLVANPSGQVTEKTVGVEYDMVADMREYESYTAGVNVQANVDVIMAGIFPIPIPVPIPTIIQDLKLFRTYSTNKVIQRSGILEKLVTHDQGQISVRRNNVFDATTGLVLVTSEDNEFGDPVYTLTTPAYWKYPRMAPAYLGNGRQWKDMSVTNGRLMLPRASSVLFKGDELLVGNRMAWVHQIDPTGADLIDEIGRPWGSVDKTNVKIIRSGKRNMQGLTVSSVTSLENPVRNGSIITSQKVLDAEVNTYSEGWQTYAGFNIIPARYQCQCPEPDACQKEVLQEMVRIGMRERLYNAQTSIRHKPSKEFISRIISCWSLTAAGGNIFLHFTYGLRSMTVRIMDGDNVICTLELQFAQDSGMQQFPEQGLTQEQLDAAKAKVKGKSPDPSFAPQNTQFIDACGNQPSSFVMNLIFNMPGQQIPVKLNGVSSCLQRNCTLVRIPADTFCTVSNGNVINPYRLGVLGNPRILASYNYRTDRTVGELRNSGFYQQFSDFDFNNNNNPNWEYNLRNVTIDPFGKTLESTDALGRHDAILYAYDRNIKAAEATNARYRQIAFDSFEDYDYDNHRLTTGECVLPQHFSFARYWNASTRCDTFSHSGYNSFRIAPGKSYAESKLIYEALDNNSSADNILAVKHQIGGFNPDTGKYLIQAWVSHDNINQPDSEFALEVTVGGRSPQTVRFMPQGKIIDGWQMITGEFNIPRGSTTISIKMDNKSRFNYYLDDIRILPFDANMTTHTVDPIQLRVMASMDENHFATFYEYDDEGNLSRIKRETEEGVFTVKEIRSSKPKVQR